MSGEASSSRHPNKQRSDSQSQSESSEELEETEYYNGDGEEYEEYEDDPEGEEEEGDESDETGDYDEEVDSVDGTEDEQEEAGANSESDSVTLTDPEVLDCPICYNPLTSPVFQVWFLVKFTLFHGFVLLGIHEIDEILICFKPGFSFFPRYVEI